MYAIFTQFVPPTPSLTAAPAATVRLLIAAAPERSFTPVPVTETLPAKRPCMKGLPFRLPSPATTRPPSPRKPAVKSTSYPFKSSVDVAIAPSEPTVTSMPQ